MIKEYAEEQAEFDARANGAHSEYPGEKLDAFLGELTDLSRKYGVGIGDGTLFIMESGIDGDFTATYSADEQSNLSFR